MGINTMRWIQELADRVCLVSGDCMEADGCGCGWDAWLFCGPRAAASLFGRSLPWTGTARDWTPTAGNPRPLVLAHAARGRERSVQERMQLTSPYLTLPSTLHHPSPSPVRRPRMRTALLSALYDTTMPEI